jgi:hypothetical protein
VISRETLVIKFHRVRTPGIRSKLAALLCLAAAGTAWFLPAQAQAPPRQNQFDQKVQPFLKKNCVTCHNVDNMTSGVRVDHLDAALDERHLKLWEAVRHRIADGSMPPKGMPRPNEADRQAVTAWIGEGLEIARLRPSPKNGLVRRLTVAQYRNTVRELLGLDDDFTEILPPEAISKDGFINNKDTLQLSPLLIEAYLEIAGKALDAAIVDPAKKPVIQRFRMDLGAGVNPSPIPDKLILGAGSQLLDKSDVLVTEPPFTKPFAFTPFKMRTKYRFIEGYQGNDTVRGWRDFDSIYHAVFADMRGSGGYPKGKAYGTVREGLLLRPAIPNDELFTEDGTYGPKANFKISLRELPSEGPFRITVTAAKYNDGLMLDAGSSAAAANPASITALEPRQERTITIPQAGIYQVDVHAEPLDRVKPAIDGSRLSSGLGGHWTFEDEDPAKIGRMNGNAKLKPSPFGKALSLNVGSNADVDALEIPRTPGIDVGAGDFTIAAWIHPRQLRQSGILAAGGHKWTPGWFFEIAEGRGALHFETTGLDNLGNGTIDTPVGVIKPNAWQHVAVTVRRGTDDSRIYVNGYQVGRGEIRSKPLDNPRRDLQIGAVHKGPPFKGEIDEVRIYQRALDPSEIQALVEPGRKFAQPPPERPQDVFLTLGGREFSGALQQDAFVAVRLPAGPLKVKTRNTGIRAIEKAVFTPIAPESALAKRFVAFEKRAPILGVHLGFRRDCGSTFAQVGEAKRVANLTPGQFVFEGARRNYPDPDEEKDNVNYLAGVREIAVRSEYTDGRDMPRLAIQSVEFEGPYYETWPPPPHRAIFVSQDPRQIIRNFATRAYRRPVTPAEEASLFAVYQKSMAAKPDFRAAIKSALQVALTSPQFLFLIEQSATPAPEPLTGFELASKLSYFLWNGPPDARLLRLAAAGQLPSQLDAEVDRMIADPKFARFTQEFASQWLALDKFQVLEPDKKRFPQLTRENRAHLKREPVEFLQYLIRKNLPVRNLVHSDFVVANEVVASYYDLGQKTESGLEFTPVAHMRQDVGGVMTQASIMAGLSDGRESNPVKRGAWLARKIVAEPPDDPPPNVPALKEEESGLTLRQRLEQHRNQPGCRQCHAKIDPWGVAFEEFDAGGRMKKQPVDAKSTLPDKTEVSGIVDLKRYLAEDRIDQVAFSVLRHLLVYANGRNLTYRETNQLKQDVAKLRATEFRVRDLIRYTVHSDIFLEK